MPNKVRSLTNTWSLYFQFMNAIWSGMWTDLIYGNIKLLKFLQNNNSKFQHLLTHKLVICTYAHKFTVGLSSKHNMHIQAKKFWKKFTIVFDFASKHFFQLIHIHHMLRGVEKHLDEKKSCNGMADASKRISNVVYLFGQKPVSYMKSWKAVHFGK